MIKIIVPATSANLGVGYDCLGLAVDILAKFIFTSNEHRLTITGCPTEFQTPDNLVYRSFVKGCQALHQPVPNVKINIQTQVPVSRGLGSSATCTVGGLMAAGEWFNTPFSKEQLLVLANEIEGHPDNVAPAIYGGLCLAVQHPHRNPEIIRYTPDPQYQLLAIIPDFKISTRQARNVLPHQLDYSTATYQISHALLMIHALQNGNLEQLKTGLQDQMQQPYRAKLIHHWTELSQIIDKFNGAHYISGSGSTVMAIVKSTTASNHLSQAISERFPNWKVIKTSLDLKGSRREME